MNRLSTRGLRGFAALVVSTAALVVTPGLVSSSSATTQWTLDTPLTTSVAWSSVNFLNGQWIALSHTGEVGVSSNGSSWSEESTPAGSWQSAAYGAGHYIALSSANTASNEMISSNGLQWSLTPGLPGAPVQAGRPVEDGQWTSVAYGHGLFVAVGSDGTLDTSPNGLSWTQRFWRPENNFTSITYGGGRFIAVDAAQGDILLSLNGLNWSLIRQPLVGAVSAPSGGVHFGAVAYGSGNFVAFGDSSSGAGYVATSVFGHVWALHQYSPAEAIGALAYGCGSFVAGGQSNGTTDPILSSTTGSEWSATEVNTPAASNWIGLSYGAGKYVALDEAGDIAVSTAADCSELVPSAPLQVSGNVGNGEVWTYMHPSLHAGGAPVEGYRVDITDGVTTTYCRAAVYFQPNCIIKGLRNHRVYWVSTQAYNRFGYSAPTDPEFVVPVANWSLAVAGPPETTGSLPSDSTGATSVDLQLTGIIAKAGGFYPVTTVSVHLGSTIQTCRPSPFGECIIGVTDPPSGAVPTYVTYTGWGRSYRSPTRDLVIPSA